MPLIGDARSISRSVERGGGTFLVELRQDGSGVPVSELVRTAERVVAGMGVRAGVAPLPNGCFIYADSMPRDRQFVAELTAQWNALGVEGKLRSPRTRLPDYRDLHLPPLGVFLGFTLPPGAKDRPDPGPFLSDNPFECRLSDEQVGRVGDLIHDWLGERMSEAPKGERCQAFLSGLADVEISPDQGREAMVAAIAGEAPYAEVMVRSRNGQWSVTYAHDGSLTLRATGRASAGPDFQKWLAQGLAPALADPGAFDLVVVRPDVIRGWPWPSGTRARDWPSEAAMAWLVRRYLWSKFVPDAHAVQILTGSHMEKAADLSAWQVQKVGADRWLVQARELKPWWHNWDTEGFWEPTRPDVLDQARADFGDMIFDADSVDPEEHRP